MNKHIKEVVVRRIYKHQIWTEVISIEQYYGELQISETRRNPSDATRRCSPEVDMLDTRRQLRISHEY
jgi:hypothetical protein